MSKLYFEEIIRHKITHPSVGTSFLMDSSRDCFVSRGKAELLEEQLHFCHHPSVMPVWQQSSSLSPVVSAQTQQQFGCDPQGLPWKYIQQKSGRDSELWDEVAHQRSAQQPKAKKILTLWSPKELLLQCLHLYLFPFGSAAQVMSSEAVCSSPGLASWTSWALLWVLSSLRAQCPALGDDVQRGDTRKAPMSPREIQ